MRTITAIIQRARVTKQWCGKCAKEGKKSGSWNTKVREREREIE